MDHSTLKRMERAVLEDLDAEGVAALERDLAAHPEALERMRALGRLTAELRDAPPAAAPPDLAQRVVARLKAQAAGQRSEVQRCSQRDCAMLFAVAGVFYLLLGAAAWFTLDRLGLPGTTLSGAGLSGAGLAGQSVPALVSGCALLALAGLLTADGRGMLWASMMGAVLHALAWAASGMALILTARSMPLALAGLAMAWTGLVAGAFLADAARQALGRLRVCRVLAPTGPGHGLGGA